jgi:hypothetical protein
LVGEEVGADVGEEVGADDAKGSKQMAKPFF